MPCSYGSERNPSSQRLPNLGMRDADDLVRKGGWVINASSPPAGPLQLSQTVGILRGRTYSGGEQRPMNPAFASELQYCAAISTFGNFAWAKRNAVFSACGLSNLRAVRKDYFSTLGISESEKGGAKKGAPSQRARKKCPGK